MKSTTEGAGQQILKSAAWTMLGRLLSLSLKFLTVPILARLLMPEQFGLIAASIVVVMFVAMLGGMGLPSALVAEAEDQPLRWHRVFTFTFLLGIALALLLVLSADSVSGWLGDVEMSTVLAVLAWLIPLQIAGDVSEAMLTRRMWFDRMAIWQVLADALGAIGAVLAALAGWGVWALVLQQFVSASIRVSGNLYVAGFVPKPAWSFSEIVRLSHFGSRVMLSDLLLYWCIQGPVAIVSRMLGTQATGFFSVSNRFVELPNQVILSSLATVLFPSFAAMADQPARLSRALLRSAQLTTALQAPVMFGLAAVAEPAMSLLFGDKWLQAWPVFALLALAKGVMAPCGGFGAFLKGVGRADVLWRLTFIRAVLVSLLCVAGAWGWGLVGLVTGILLSNFLFTVIFGVAVFRVASISAVYGLGRVLIPLVHAAFMGAIAYGALGWLQARDVSEFGQLLMVMLVGGAVYGVLILMFQGTTRETINQLLERSRAA